MIKKEDKWITWAEFFKDELPRYGVDCDDALLSALDDIMEENQ